ncbi:hypothetical protein GCM10020229_37000 [Kitasatospora albolonga]
MKAGAGAPGPRGLSEAGSGARSACRGTGWGAGRLWPGLSGFGAFGPRGFSPAGSVGSSGYGALSPGAPPFWARYGFGSPSEP